MIKTIVTVALCVGGILMLVGFIGDMQTRIFRSSFNWFNLSEIGAGIIILTLLVGERFFAQ